MFIKDGNYYIVKKDKHESIEKFNERGWFIANLAPTNEMEYNEAVKLSRIFINVKYNGCIYDITLMNKINGKNTNE